MLRFVVQYRHIDHGDQWFSYCAFADLREARNCQIELFADDAWCVEKRVTPVTYDSFYDSVEE